MMRRTFANWGGRPWWFWRRLADRRERRDDWSPLDLGSDLLAWWDASEGVSLSGSNVTAWADRKNAYSAAQGTAASQPTWAAADFNGKPSLTFDGTDDCLTLASQPFGSGAIDLEVWALVQQDVPGATTDTRAFFGMGSGTSPFNRIRVFRVSSSSVSRLSASTGNGTAAPNTTTFTSPFDGRCLVRYRARPTTAYLSIDGETEVSTSVVPNVGTTRVRIGADAGDTAALFWKGKIAHVLLMKPTTPAYQKARVQSLFLASRNP